MCVSLSRNVVESRSGTPQQRYTDPGEIQEGTKLVEQQAAHPEQRRPHASDNRGDPRGVYSDTKCAYGLRFFRENVCVPELWMQQRDSFRSAEFCIGIVCWQSQSLRINFPQALCHSAAHRKTGSPTSRQRAHSVQRHFLFSFLSTWRYSLEKRLLWKDTFFVVTLALWLRH